MRLVGRPLGRGVAIGYAHIETGLAIQPIRFHIEAKDIETEVLRLHTAVSGVAHLAVKNEMEALAMVRKYLSYIPSNNIENPPFVQCGDDPSRMDEHLNNIIPIDPSQPYGMARVASIVPPATSPFADGCTYVYEVADPVEQTVYMQQLARRLKVDERAMFDQMRVVSSAPTKQRRHATPVPETPKRDTTDLEQYILSAMLRHPHVVSLIDEALDRAELPPLAVDDFAQLGDLTG